MSEHALPRRLVVAGIRLLLGFMFFTGGISKLMPFPGVMGPVWLEQELEPHGLALFARFIAWSELVIGMLVLSGRFATLGAIMMVPLIANILVVVTSMEWRGTPWVVGGLLMLNVVLLAHDWPRWRFLLIDTDAPRTVPTRRARPAADAVSIVAMALIAAAPLVYAALGGPTGAEVLAGTGSGAGTAEAAAARAPIPFIAYVPAGVGLVALFAAAAWPRRRRARAPRAPEG